MADIVVSHRETLNADLFEQTATYDMSQNSTLNLTATKATSTVNISGNETFTSNADLSAVTVNITPGSKWDGTFSQHQGTFAANGGGQATFNNDGESSISVTTVTLDADVIGKGGFSVLGFGTLEFVQGVNPTLSVDDGQQVIIDQPSGFKASITLEQPTTFRTTEIDLNNLANADSYTFQNDLLAIYSGNTVIDTLKLADKTSFGFDVVRTAGGVNIETLMSPGETIPGALPLHT
jgi:hypothetical protein